MMLIFVLFSSEVSLALPFLRTRTAANSVTLGLTPVEDDGGLGSGAPVFLALAAPSASHSQPVLGPKLPSVRLWASVLVG